jgi:hypothetical protein
VHSQGRSAVQHQPQGHHKRLVHGHIRCLGRTRHFVLLKEKNHLNSLIFLLLEKLIFNFVSILALEIIFKNEIKTKK